MIKVIVQGFILFSVSFLTMACGQARVSSQGAESTSSYQYSFCGTIERPSGGLTGGSNDLRVDSDAGTYFLMGANAQIQNELDQIVYPNDYYMGCVHGDQLGSGYEGAILYVKKLELRGTR